MGVLDGLKRAVGMPTAEVESSEAMRARMERSGDPSDAFALVLADRLMGYNQGPLEKALPEMAAGGGRWSKDPERRWADIARTARGVADDLARTPLPNMDADLSAAVTRGSLVEAARSYGGRGPVSRHLGEARDDLGRRVGAVLAGGADAERLAVTNARHMGQRRQLGLENDLIKGTAEHVRLPQELNRERHVQWLLDANRAFLAMAKRGLAPDDAVVAYARDTAVYHPGVQPPVGRVARDAAPELPTPEARRAIVAREVEGSMQAVDVAAGRRVSPPFRPVEMTVIPTAAQVDAARESEMRALPDAEWMSPGGRRMTARIEGMLVGERAGREINDAIAGRNRDGDGWSPGRPTMIPATLLRGASQADLQSARAGAIDKVEDEALRLTMTEIRRDARQLHHAQQHDYGHHARHAEQKALEARKPAPADGREPGSLIRRGPSPAALASMGAGRGG